MRGVDINQFQFDFDMTWYGFFMNADGTVYARYGSRNGERKDSDKLMSISGLKKTMQRALDIHKSYPGNKDGLKDKKGAAMKYPTADRIPWINAKVKNDPLPKGCIHCHHVWQGLRRDEIDNKKPLSDSLVWIYPLPDNIGLKIDIDDGTKVKEIVAGSPAEKAGLKAGDEIQKINGQTIASMADIQWVLQNSAAKATLKVDAMRGSESKSFTISLSGSWKEYDITWRESLWEIRPGFRAVDATDDEKKKAGVDGNKLALKVKFVFQNGPAMKSGVKQDDVLVEFDGKSDSMDESHFIALVRQKYAVGAKVPAVFMRNGKRVKLTLEIQ